MKKFCIAVHGGAGDLPFLGMDKKREGEFKQALEECLSLGYRILAGGGSALDAVELTVRALEDEPIFNAGRGSSINRDGIVEMDSAIMCGKTLRAGAVTCVTNIKNPVALARKVMDHCEHLYLSAEGALDFAKEIGMELMPMDYFITEERYAKWQHKRKTGGTADVTRESGTAGAVALDMHGNLASATSTGGLTNKRKGRIADTSIIGAGTYANNLTCAVSCTGTGEYIIRTVAAHETSSLLSYKGLSLHEACEHMLLERLMPLGGQFGMIAIDNDGDYKCVFNTERMYRAWRSSDGAIEIDLY